MQKHTGANHLKQLRCSGPGLLVSLVEEHGDVFEGILKKLDCDEIRSLCQVCRALRHRCRPLLLQFFVHRTLRLNTADHFKEYVKAEGIQLGCDWDVLDQKRFEGRQHLPGKEGDLVACSYGYGILAWGHFPSETQFIQQSSDVCYWLLDKWVQQRQHFLDICQGSSTVQAVLQCGGLSFGVRQLFRLMLDEDEDGISWTSVFPMEAWWPIEVWSDDYYSQHRMFVAPNVLVHVESAVYKAAAANQTNYFLRSHALLYTGVGLYAQSPRLYEASMDQNFPGIISGHLFWVHTDHFS